jgi:hypothetical protein
MIRKIAVLAGGLVLAAGMTLTGAVTASASPAAPDVNCHNPVYIHNSYLGDNIADPSQSPASGDDLETFQENQAWCQVANGSYTLFRLQGTSLCMTAQTNESGAYDLLACEDSRTEQNFEWGGVEGSSTQLITEYNANKGNKDVTTCYATGHGINDAVNGFTNYQLWVLNAS